MHGLADADIDTNVRTNIADGGVDTELREAMLGDTTGWAQIRTIWQYKGTGYSSLRVAELIKGAHLRRRIEEGWAYRLAIADSMPSDKRTELETELFEKFREMNPHAAPPRVVTADDLQAWANRYLGLILSTFYRDATRDVVHLQGWRESVQSATPLYVPVASWEGTREQLAAHVNFLSSPPSALRTVQGEAGVGKTRLVYEVVSAIPGADALVVYALEDSVIAIARQLVNDRDATAIVVADECSADTRLQLMKLLDGHRSRVRVIAIDNVLTRPDTPDPELAIGKMPQPALEEILAKNFAVVDAQRRRAYVEVADGFPRLAADLCIYDAKIAAQGALTPVIPRIGEFYKVRLSSEQQQAVDAIAMVGKIGYAGTVAHEMVSLCEFLRLPLEQTLQALDAVLDGPGFVTRSGRYYQVTPELIAQVAFDQGWRRWGSRDPEAFFAGLPASLLEPFLHRVWRSAPEEVRHACAARFRDWAEQRTATDLANVETVRDLVTLVDTKPTQFLPLVRRLIEGASVPELESIIGGAVPSGGWGARRALVWLAERFAQLPEHFDDAERILARLAAVETEPDIANNATAIWGQGFRIFLSGTPVPFSIRLAKLRERLRDPMQEVRVAARRLLHATLTSEGMRMAGPLVVAGRIPPAEWQPSSYEEVKACLNEALELLGEVVQWDEPTRAAVVKTIDDSLAELLTGGYLAVVQSIVARGALLHDSERLALIGSLDDWLAYSATELVVQEPTIATPADPAAAIASTQQSETQAAESIVAPESAASNTVTAAPSIETYIAQIQKWRDELVGSRLFDRLTAFVSKARWGSYRTRDEKGWQRDIDSLAIELAAALERNALEAVDILVWLATPAAETAGELGEALGRRDQNATLFDPVMSLAVPGANLTFPRGYALGLVAQFPEHAPKLAAWLDVAETTTPEIAADVALSAGLLASPLERVLRLYDVGRLDPRYLYARGFPPDASGELPIHALRALLDRLAAAAESGNQFALRIGLDNLAMRLPYKAEATAHPFLVANPELQTIAWRLLDAVPAQAMPPSHWWSSLVTHLAHIMPERAASYLARLMSTTNLRLDHSTEGALVEIAARSPDAVMSAVGEIMLDDSVNVRFYLGNYRTLFGAIPDDIKRAWVERSGVECARRMARHLSPPAIDEDGRAIVPPFTEWLLRTFEEDDKTFREFTAGVHSWQMYRGDIAAQHETEATVARRFLDHPLPRIREWATLEERRASASAAEERQRVAEQDL